MIETADRLIEPSTPSSKEHDKSDIISESGKSETDKHEKVKRRDA